MLKIGTKFYYGEESQKSGLLDEIIEYNAVTKLYTIKYTSLRVGYEDFYTEREEFIRNKMEKYGYKQSWEITFSYPKKGSKS